MNVINFFGVASFSKKPEKYGQGIGLWAFFEKWYDQFSGGGGGGSGSTFGKVNTCNLVFIKFAHCVYFNDYLRSCC